MSMDNSSDSKEVAYSTPGSKNLEFPSFMSDHHDFSSDSPEICNPKVPGEEQSVFLTDKMNSPSYEKITDFDISRDGRSNDEVAQSPTSFKPTALGVDRAKKLLQALCTQKKQFQTATSSPIVNSDSGSNSVGKRMTRFSDISEDYDNTKNNAVPKKSSKKGLSSYERRHMSFMDMKNLDKDENTKWTLDKLGVPLSLVPGGTVVKGLTPKPMPTKAMPPIKNFLNPEEIESLLEGASSFNTKNSLIYRINKKDSDKMEPYKRSNNPGQINNRNTFSKGSYSNDSRRYDRRNSKNDSYSRHYRDTSSKSRNHSSGRYSDRYDKKIDSKSSSEFNLKSNSSKTGSESRYSSNDPDTSDKEIPKNPSPINPDNANVTDDKIESDIPETVKPEEPQEPQEPELGNKFLRDTFLPLEPELRPRRPKLRDFSISPLNNYTDDLQKSPFSDMSMKNFDRVNSNVYSPGMNSSSESSHTILNCLTNSQTSQDSNFLNLSLESDCKLPYITNRHSLSGPNEKSNIWDDIIQTCYPKMHSSSDCYRVTDAEPYLEYCENLKSCKCRDKRQQSLENLLNNVGTIRGQIPSGDVHQAISNTSQAWYPKINIALTSNASFHLISCWESEDSYSNHGFYIKNETTPKVTTNNLLNIDSKLFSIDKKPIIDFESPLDLNADTNKMEINSPAKVVDNPPIVTSTLVSEYEKFMEAVCPAVSDEYPTEHSASTRKESNLTNFEGMESEKVPCNKFDELDLSTRINTSTKIIDINEDNPNIVNHESTIDENLNNDLLNKWTTESESDGGRINKKHSNSKSDKKRKGHAKISSRRTKGKHKNSSKSQKRHSSSSDYSSSSDDSKSDSSSSSTSTSSTSSSDSSLSSSESTFSSDDSSSSSDSSYSSDLSSTNSTNSSDELKSKRKSKKIQLKKKYRKLSKSKRKKLLIVAKAKELAKKMKNKKKKKKLRKDKLAQEKKKQLVPNEHIEICNNGKSYNISSAILSDDSKKSKRKSEDGSKIESKKRKRSYSSNESTSGSSTSSESSTQSDDDNIDNKNKRKISASDDSSDYENNRKKNKSNDESTDIDKFNVDTLAMIKTEKTSDTEDAKLKAMELPRAPYRHQIINASELQNDFLQGSKKYNLLDVKMESMKKIDTTDKIEDQSADTTELNLSDQMKQDEILANEERLKLQFDAVENFMSPIKSSSTQSDDVGKNEKSKDLQSDWKTAVKNVKKERKTRWGNPSTVNISPHDFNSFDKNQLNESLIDKTECPQVDSETDDNKIYKIQTISSCGIGQNDSVYNDEEAAYEMDYDMYGKELPIEETFVVKSSPRKLSLDDRINMVLLGPDDSLIAIEEPPILNNTHCSVSPEKGILISSSRTMRADPRINRAKRVCFADGFLPGQDSDLENEVVITPEKELSKAKKRLAKSSGGHAYPCPETWPDYHPHWDRLPPPPPPPGSPPPELYEKVCSTPLSIINMNTTSQIRPAKIINILENLPVS